MADYVKMDNRGAVIEGDHRYTLTRQWGDGARCTFIMLNPSTADATKDDPTIRRCLGFARRLGCESSVVANLYAYRATNPFDLWKAADPVGPLNNRYLIDVALDAERNGTPLIAAWGALAKRDRVLDVLRLPGMQRLSALGVTKSGAPRHPLYLGADAELRPWLGGE